MFPARPGRRQATHVAVSVVLRLIIVVRLDGREDAPLTPFFSHDSCESLQGRYDFYLREV